MELLIFRYDLRDENGNVPKGKRLPNNYINTDAKIDLAKQIKEMPQPFAHILDDTINLTINQLFLFQLLYNRITLFELGKVFNGEPNRADELVKIEKDELQNLVKRSFSDKLFYNYREVQLRDIDANEENETLSPNLCVALMLFNGNYILSLPLAK